MNSFDPKKTIYIIDGSSFLYRAYYAMKPLHTKQGEPVQAVYGFIRMIKKLMNMFNPAYMVVVWDAPGKTVRHELFTGYKATRQAPPSDLFEQKKRIKKFITLIQLADLEIPGIEADDLMYSLGKDMKAVGFDVVLVTTDKDMGQMIDEHTFVYDSFKDLMYDTTLFEQKMGFPVTKLPFYFALLGDSSDNIPGVRGIGQKGALELVNQFTSLEDMYAHLDNITKPRTRLALEQNKENAFLSYQLFLLRYYPPQVTKKQLIFDPGNWQASRPLLQELNFASLLKDMHEPAIQESFLEPKKKVVNYECIKVTTQDALAQMVAAIREKKVCAIDTETTGIRLLVDEIVGISCAVQEGIAWYVPFGHKVDEPQLSREQVFEALKPLLEDATIHKIMHHASFDNAVLWHAGVNVQGIVFDTLIAAKLISKDWQSASLKALSETYLHETMLSYQEVVKDNKYQNFAYVPLDLATLYAAADAHQTLKLYYVLQKLLEQEDQKKLFDLIEQPLQHILLEMEQRGIYVDTFELAQLGKRVTAELLDIEDAIIQQAGPAYAGINLNSPKQVEHLLFHELKLTPQKKSAKGSYSTDSQVLQALAKEHPIPGLIAKYRELAKLKTTYIDALPTYVNPKTSKIHTHFSQVAVATGRLSSSDPNLQNIPAAHGYGIEVRAAFKADEDSLFISADYSQIELRVLAYLSQDPSLINAFKQEIDIHTQTAARLFGVAMHDVSHQQRQIGKRINFSVLYGLTPYGLSKDLGISFKEAKQYIDAYFEQYPTVRNWMDTIVAQTKESGFVTTLYGRRRYIPAIYESNHALYQEAVRIAINTVVQGTAAELMKVGMLKLDRAIREKNISAHIILQIHDELLISCPKGQEGLVAFLVKEVLENIVNWNVPLQVTTRVGYTWKDVTK